MDDLNYWGISDEILEARSISEVEIPRPQLGKPFCMHIGAGAYYLDRVLESTRLPKRFPLDIKYEATIESKEQERLNSSVDDFFKNQYFYESKSVMHKKGILLYGVPGTGKTTLIKKMVKESLNKDRIIFFGRSPYIVSESLNVFRKSEKTRPVIVVMEDLDEIIKGWGTHDILEMLDGLNSIDHVLFVATANDPQILPDKLKRPGRLDEKILVPRPSTQQRIAYITANMGHVIRPEYIPIVAKKTKDFSFSELKEMFINVCNYGVKVKDAIKVVSEDSELREYEKERMASGVCKEEDVVMKGKKW